ncbi:MAG: pyrophosphatase [Kineosporiaceae bacterium]|nr:pyrophosphatase [Kineosporiaceae bacterium]MBK7622722.1 pyrophosphatase [Kineosporiaceae bacterium]
MQLAELTATVERVSEGYADRFGIDRTPDWFLMKLQEELGELTQVHLQRQGQARTKGLSAHELDEAFGGEVADVLGQLLLLAHHHGIDLEREMRRKWFRWLPTPERDGPQPVE